MNKLFNIFLLCSFTCCSIHAFAEEKTEQTLEVKEEPTKNVKLEKYTNTDNGYTIEFPANWKKNDVPELDIVLIAPPLKNEKPHASMNIVSNNVGQKINLDDFYSESTKNLSSALKEVKVDKIGSQMLNGTPSKWVQYTHVMQGVKFRVLQYFIVGNNRIFLMTFSAPNADFSGHQQNFEDIADTFTLITPETP